MENFNYKGYRANNILKSFGQLQDIMKGGKGSGRKIGMTKSGKNIYDHFEHEGHKDFTSEDHKDAALNHANKIDILKRKKKTQDKNAFTSEESINQNKTKHEEHLDNYQKHLTSARNEN